MLFVLLAFLWAAAHVTCSTCPPGCGVCCTGYCCQSGQSCCDGYCQDSCDEGKTAIWIIVGIVVAIIVALIAVCLIIACIYCCSATANRQGTTVRSLRPPPPRARHAAYSRSPRPAYQPRSEGETPRVWSLSDPSRNLTFSRHSPGFAPPPPGFVVSDGSAHPAISPRPLALPPSPRSARLPTAPFPEDGFQQDDQQPQQTHLQHTHQLTAHQQHAHLQHSHQPTAHQQNAHLQQTHQLTAHQQNAHLQNAHQQNAHLQASPDTRKVSGGPEPAGEEDAESTPATERPPSVNVRSASVMRVQSSSKSAKPVFTRSPKVSTAGLAEPSPRLGAKISTGSVDPRSPRHVEITSLDSDDDALPGEGMEMSLAQSNTQNAQ